MGSEPLVLSQKSWRNFEPILHLSHQSKDLWRDLRHRCNSLNQYFPHKRESWTFSPSGLMNKSVRGEGIRLVSPRRLHVMSKRRLICQA